MKDIGNVYPKALKSWAQVIRLITMAILFIGMSVRVIFFPTASRTVAIWAHAAGYLALALGIWGLILLSSGV